MERNFQRSLSLVLAHEGGFSDHPADNGGPTNKGVTIATFRAYVKPSGTVEDLKKLTTEQAGTVYRREYWNRIAGAEMPDGLDYAMFDFAVNSGPARAAKYLQAILGVEVDGAIGPQTMKAVAEHEPAGLVASLCDGRMRFLKGLADWATFGKGWTRRVTDVREEAGLMLARPLTGATVPAASTVAVSQPAPAPIQPTAVGLPAIVGSASKAFGAARGAAKGAAITPAVTLLGSRLNVFPDWIWQPESIAAITLIGGVLIAAGWAFVSTYKAKPNTTEPAT